jgi:radical SAM superfamily enzyme YgiQ (UPF0313 family)
MHGRMKILLVQPAPFEPGRLGLENACWLSEPVALTSLAAMVPEHECRILDMRLEKDGAFNRMLLEFRPDIVATTSMTTDCYQAKALLQCAKGTLGDDKVFTMVGGHHPTLAPHDFEEDCIDALVLGEGEDTFRETVAYLAARTGATSSHAATTHEAGSAPPRTLHDVAGLRFRDGDRWVTTAKRAQSRELDSFPDPRRDLIAKYRGSYFFMNARPMASISTSRGCSYDCNFCAIWEFYERKTRFLSAKRVCDLLEKIDEPFVMFLDDNFLTHRSRLLELCDEIERRGLRKLWATQGRTDFVANNPEIMARLRKCGLTLLISGYETNDDKGLEALKKTNAGDTNRKAAKILNDLGILQFGIFMVRPDFDHADFDFMYKSIDEMGICFPIVTVHTPLPGTQLRKRLQSELLTEDARLFDLLHSVRPTKLPRAEFYHRLTETYRRPWLNKSTIKALLRRPDFLRHALPATPGWIKMIAAYYPVMTSGESNLRDEIGIIDEKAPWKRELLPILNEAAE